MGKLVKENLIHHVDRNSPWLEIVSKLSASSGKVAEKLHKEMKAMQEKELRGNNIIVDQYLDGLPKPKPKPKPKPAAAKPAAKKAPAKKK